MEKAFSLKGNATAKVHRVAQYVETQKILKMDWKRLPSETLILEGLFCFYLFFDVSFLKGYWFNKQACIL